MDPAPSKLKKYGLYLLIGLGGMTLLGLLAGIGMWAVEGLRHGMPGGGGYPSMYAGKVAPPSPPESDSMAFEESASSVDTEDTPSSLAERKVIQNAHLSLLVQSVEEAVQTIKETAAQFKGFVVTANVREETEERKSGSVTIKVPAKKFEEAIGTIKKLAIKVYSEEVKAQDVTEEFIDLEAQLRNLKAEETQYLDIMKKAVRVKDVLRVSSKLSDVRGRIEQIEGRRKYLSQQVDMSSIEIYLSEEDIRIFGKRVSFLVVVKQSIRTLWDGLRDYVDALVGFVFLLPLILLWVVTIGLLLILGFRFVRWVYRRFLKT